MAPQLGGSEKMWGYKTKATYDRPIFSIIYPAESLKAEYCVKAYPAYATRIMYFPAKLSTIIYIYSLALGSAATPCPEPTDSAQGGLPSVGLLTTITTNAIKELQLAVFLENLELSFFNMSLTNLGYWGTNEYSNDTIQAVEKIAAQVEVHLGTLANVLDDNNAAPIPPCTYSFPIASTDGFFDLAHLITSVGIGATIGIVERLATMDSMLARLVSSILTVESRHDEFFRSANGKEPNPTPFDTGINGIWAYNLALSYVVPGSCLVELPLPILPRLTVVQAIVTPCANSTAPYANFTTPYTNTTTQLPNAMSGSRQLEFSWDPTQEPFVAESGKQLLIGWVNQLNAPIYTPLEITTTGSGIASVPEGVNGIAFAAVTVQQPGNFDDLALATLAGPIVISLS